MQGTRGPFIGLLHPLQRLCCPHLCCLAGLLRGVYVGAADSCLYAETFAADLAGRKITDPKTRQQVGWARRNHLVLSHHRCLVSQLHRD